MIENFKEKYQKLDKTSQLRIKQGTIGIIITIILIFSYGNKTDKIIKESIIKDESQTVDVITNAQLFEKDISEELDEKLNKKQAIIDQQTQDIKQLKELFALQMQENNQKDLNQDNTNELPKNFPPVPEQLMGESYSRNSELQIQPQWVGGIAHEEYEEEIENSEKTQKKRTIKLPPSFMKGFLLTGMDAMTIEGSNDTPEPMMIRVQAPAVLPNEVKANLKGCFVIAEGYGNLATHRVDARLKSLSCINFEGNSIIFEKIKGYVQDGDGKRGIKGKPIHRAGALVARSMIAGAFEGIGSALSSSAQTSNISALGSTTTTNSGSLGKAAIGSSISAGAKDVRTLFLQLARQSSPIIEIGAAKQISVIITELVVLNIQEL